MISPSRALLAICLSSPVAMGQLLVPTGQDRHVEARASAVGGTAEETTESATDFGPFGGSVSAEATGPGGSAMCSASQESSVLADALVFHGVHSANGSGDGAAYSEAVASVDFTVTHSLKYEIHADYVSFGNGYFSYDLIRSNGDTIDGWFGDLPGAQSIHHVGQLDPGNYTLILDVTGSAPLSFAEVDATMQLSELAVSYCIAAANSAGAGAHLIAAGSHSLAENAFALEASDLPPNVFGLARYGPNQIQVPFGDGFRCVGGKTYRLHPPLQADPTGHLTKSLDFNVGPLASGSGQVLPGSDWNFQLWYRDPMGPGGTGSNTTDAVQATFLP